MLGLIAQGMRDRGIAAALTLSEHTVHRHMPNIYGKLGCSTRAAAVAKAGELKLLCTRPWPEEAIRGRAE